jgi:ankyrin repeat protein
MQEKHMSSDHFISAALNGDLRKVQALAADADEFALKAALVNAAKEGHGNVVELLLAKGADLNGRLPDGYTSLTMACRGAHWDIAKVLIANGADVNIATGKGYTALIFAASEGQLEVVEALVANGADVNTKTVAGTTALLLTSMKGYKNFG